MAAKKRNNFITSALKMRNRTSERVGKSLSRSLHFIGVSCIGNTVIGFGKLIMGVLSLSFFTCANAFYTFGMVIAKCCAFVGIVKEEDIQAQYRYYKLSGIVLIVSSLLYIIYSIWLLFHPTTRTYHMYAALAIATFTFTELTVNIRGVIVYRHNHTPLVHAVKMINLAASLICLVLTQTAILSFTPEAVDVHPSVNGFMGILMGSAAGILGIIMIVRITTTEKTENIAPAGQSTQRLCTIQKNGGNEYDQYPCG